MTFQHPLRGIEANRAGLIVGAGVLLAVAVAYTVSLRAGRWPPSHPWSGFTLVMLALNVAFTPVGSKPRFAPAVQIGIRLLAVVSTLLWLAATFMQRGR